MVVGCGSGWVKGAENVAVIIKCCVSDGLITTCRESVVVTGGMTDYICHTGI